CYNFMPLDDWTRTAFDVSARGGALTNEFDLGALEGKLAAPEKRICTATLWENLTIFIHEIAPVAQKAGVQLALHPDDPPIPRLLGADQIMHAPAAFTRLFEIEPNPANGMCLCTGTFGAAGEDIPTLIEQFGSRIHYVHFRNMVGQVPHFVEPFHDDGDLAMPVILHALHKAGFRGSLRPDHVPQMDGESGLADGYSMLGRLFAIGYIRGLLDSLEKE
ncbi:MAG: mannonate dehydratase, partial [Abditibacteriaceae bacterium]